MDCSCWHSRITSCIDILSHLCHRCRKRLPQRIHLCILAHSSSSKPPLSSRCILGIETSSKMARWDWFPGHRQEENREMRRAPCKIQDGTKFFLHSTEAVLLHCTQHCPWWREAILQMPIILHCEILCWHHNFKAIPCTVKSFTWAPVLFLRLSLITYETFYWVTLLFCLQIRVLNRCLPCLQSLGFSYV